MAGKRDGSRQAAPTSHPRHQQPKPPSQAGFVRVEATAHQFSAPSRALGLEDADVLEKDWSHV